MPDVTIEGGTHFNYIFFVLMVEIVTKLGTLKIDSLHKHFIKGLTNVIVQNCMLSLTRCFCISVKFDFLFNPSFKDSFKISIGVVIYFKEYELDDSIFKSKHIIF